MQGYSEKAEISWLNVASCWTGKPGSLVMVTYQNGERGIKDLGHACTHPNWGVRRQEVVYKYAEPYNRWEEVRCISYFEKILN